MKGSEVPTARPPIASVPSLTVVLTVNFSCTWLTLNARARAYVHQVFRKPHHCPKCSVHYCVPFIHYHPVKGVITKRMSDGTDVRKEWTWESLLLLVHFLCSSFPTVSSLVQFVSLVFLSHSLRFTAFVLEREVNHYWITVSEDILVHSITSSGPYLRSNCEDYQELIIKNPWQ